MRTPLPACNRHLAIALATAFVSATVWICINVDEPAQYTCALQQLYGLNLCGKQAYTQRNHFYNEI